ncbi:MAG: hypothetical protein QW474_01125 [Candidatus Aenigmatarchaeota archaeon]
MIRRHKQPYIINPFRLKRNIFSENPFEIFKVPERTMVAEIDEKGRFRKVKSITKKSSKSKAKKITEKEFQKLITTKNPLLVVNSKKRSEIMRKNAWIDDPAGHRKAALKGWRTRRGHRKNAWIDDPAGHRKAALKGWRTRRGYRKNPFITQKQIGEVSNLLIDGALIVAGITAGKFLMDNIVTKVKFLEKPAMKIGGQIVLGSAIYLIGSQFKKVPMRYVNLLALGIIAPAISDAVGLLTKKSEVKPVAEIGYQDTEFSAYVPETSAYVPETSVLSENEYSA